MASSPSNRVRVEEMEEPILKKPKLGDDKDDKSMTAHADDKHYYVDSDKEELTKEEFDEYCRQVNESDGFDVPTLRTEGSHCGLIRPVNIKNEENNKMINNLCQRAIADNKKWEIEFIKIIKANGSIVSGIEYHITFEAKDKKTDKIKTYQVNLWDHIDDTVTVNFFREKLLPGDGGSVGGVGGSDRASGSGGAGRPCYSKCDDGSGNCNKNKD